MPATRDQIIDALRPVQDPELHRSIVDLGMVRDVDTGRRRQRSAILIALTVPGCPLKNEIRNRVDTAVVAARRRHRRRRRLHGDDRPGARGRCASSLHGDGGHAARPRPRPGPRATPRAGRSPSPSPARGPGRC